MISFWRIFLLELTALVRSRTLALLTAASAAWMLAAPHLFRGDGTAEGARELTLHYSLGGVAALLAVALLASATGSISRERAAKRLQLTLVRPVRYAVVAFAKIAAHVATGAAVLAACAAVEACRQDMSRQCRHVLSPVLPSPREEAREMYAAYMKDPETPDAVKKAKKSVVMRLLAQRALDHYQTIDTNDVARWRFRLPAKSDGLVGAGVRLRFTNAYDIRQDVRGRLSLDSACGGFGGSVSNITRAIVDIPLERISQDAGETDPGVAALEFRNEGKSALMLRPRKDVNLLVPADSFAWNLVRAYVELVAMLSVLVSFGVFLGAGLGRPVALFTAVVALAVGEISPSVIEQYPDELETDRLDSIGLYITRAVAEVSHPVSSLEPLARLSQDACVEPGEVARAVVFGMALLPVLFAFLAAAAMPRKTDDA